MGRRYRAAPTFQLPNLWISRLELSLPSHSSEIGSIVEKGMLQTGLAHEIYE